MATATGAKPNVIVVQKAQPKRATGTGGAPTSISVVTKGPSGMQSPFEKVNAAHKHQQLFLTSQVIFHEVLPNRGLKKDSLFQELVSFIQKQDSLKTQVQKGPGGRPVLPKGLDPKRVCDNVILNSFPPSSNAKKTKKKNNGFYGTRINTKILYYNINCQTLRHL